MKLDGTGEDRIVIFATDEMLQRMCNANTLYMDGTFDACPRLFYQLFTINIYVGKQQFPALYALLPTKSRADYNRLFLIIKEEMQNRDFIFQPNRIMIDFEIALLQSIQLHFPGLDLSGCYFHFHQCLYRWIQKNGHSIEYNLKEELYNFVRRCAALAFVPLSTIRLAWFGLKAAAPDTTSAKHFIAYFQKTWMTSFPLHVWNHYCTTEDRTNNTLEGWHNRLNKLAGRDHPNLYQLIKMI